MRKKIVAMLLLGMYFFGGGGMVFATTFDPAPEGTQASPDALESLKAAGAWQKNYDTDPGTIQQRGADGAIEQPGSSTSAPSGPGAGGGNGGPDDMTSAWFILDPNALSPSEKRYAAGTSANLKAILANIGKYLLIATTTIAVLSIVVGGLMISTTGPSDRAAKGKTIIMLNIMAVVVALFSYSIIRLVSWIIAA